MRRRAAAVVALLLAAAAAQTPPSPPSPPSPPAAAGEAAAAVTPEPERAWDFGLSGYLFFAADDEQYLQTQFTADRDWLHLELRYNYEARDSTSLWLGYNWSVGEEWQLELTPMVGGVFGDTGGLAVGYRGSLGWWQLELYSEGEYFFDHEGASGDFFYNWSELTVSPFADFRCGLVTQRTRLYDSPRDVERGLLVGCAFQGLDLTVCLFDPDESQTTLVLGVGVEF